MSPPRLPWRVAAVLGRSRSDLLSLEHTRRPAVAAAVAAAVDPRHLSAVALVAAAHAPAEGAGGFPQRDFGGLCVRLPFGLPCEEQPRG